jgi:selenocysteine lyase/cysteine desulfurase
LLVADVIQSLGVLPINAQAEYIDVAAAAAHKWLLTPEGIGILYLSDRALEQIEPTLVGWTSVPNPEDYNNFEQGWNVGALPWETGTYASSLMYGLRSSLELLTSIGVEEIARYLEMLTDYLCERLSGRPYEVVSSRAKNEKSQIVSIRSLEGHSPMSLFQKLRTQHILTAPRGDGLRIAPHVYNCTDEINQLIAALP